MKKIFFPMILLILAACSRSQTAEQAANEIIGYTNKGDYAALWANYISDGDKIWMENDLEQLKKNPLGITLFATIGISENELQNMTPEEYFTKTSKFYDELIKNKENAERTVESVTQDRDSATANWRQGKTSSSFRMIKKDNKWRMALSE